MPSLELSGDFSITSPRRTATSCSPYTQTRDVEVALNALTERGLKVEIALRSPTIEDVFLKLAGFRITAEGEAK